jgi:hypothetical protein
MNDDPMKSWERGHPACGGPDEAGPSPGDAGILPAAGEAGPHRNIRKAERRPSGRRSAFRSSNNAQFVLTLPREICHNIFVVWL